MTPGYVCAGVFSSCSGELTPASGAPTGQLILLLDLGGLKPSLLALSPRVGDSGAGSKRESQRSSHLGRRSAFPTEGRHPGLSSHAEGIPSSVVGACVRPCDLSVPGQLGVGGLHHHQQTAADLSHVEPSAHTTGSVQAPLGRARAVQGLGIQVLTAEGPASAPVQEPRSLEPCRAANNSNKLQE